MYVRAYTPRSHWELPILVTRTADSQRENWRFPTRELPILVVSIDNSRRENCRFPS